MERKSPLRWVGILIAGVAAVLLLVAVIAFTSGEPREAAPVTLSPAPTAPADADVATVGGEAISRGDWLNAVALDQIMSRLAEVAIPTPRDTLERMINERLMLQNGPAAEPPTAEEVASYIVQLESAWGIGDAQLNRILDQIGVSRAALEETVARLMTVQRQQAALEAEGVPVTDWLTEQREAVEIEVDEAQVDAGDLPEQVAQVLADVATTDPSSPAATPDAALATAPDFTLPQVGGQDFTLSEQLAEGPVVLVFFQKCG